MLKTTVGQLLINNALPKELRDYNRVLGKEELPKLFTDLAKSHPEQYKDVLKKLGDIGREVSYYTGGFSPNLNSLRTSVAHKDFRHKLQNAIDKVLDTTDDEDTKQEKIIKLTSELGKDQDQKIFDEAMTEGNAVAMQVHSGARGSKTNLRSLLGSDHLYVDHRDNVIPIPIMRSYSEGLTPAEYYASTFGARKGLVDTKLGTANAGFFGKLLSQAAHRLVITGKDSADLNDEQRGMPVSVNDPDNEGALLAFPAAGYKRNTVLTPKVLKDIASRNIEHIVVRSPIVGGPGDGGLYSHDVGVREFGDLPHLGAFVGKAGADALAEQVSQSGLGSKHSGGAIGARAVGGFKALEKLVQTPKEYGGAAHSQIDGRVEKIAPAPAGGQFVTIGGEEHHIARDQDLLVKIGDTVDAGDQLSDGLPNPEEFVRHKGIGEGRRQFTAAFRQAMKNSGLTANRRNVELLARGLINHVRLTEEIGPHSPDDIVPYDVLEKNYEARDDAEDRRPESSLGHYLEKPVLHYSIGTRIQPRMVKELKQHGFSSIRVHRDKPPFEPEMLRGMDVLQHDPDWMTRMLGSHLQKGLLQAVHRGATSDPGGTSFVPAMIDLPNFNRQGKIQGSERLEPGGVFKSAALPSGSAFSSAKGSGGASSSASSSASTASSSASTASPTPARIGQPTLGTAPQPITSAVSAASPTASRPAPLMAPGAQSAPIQKPVPPQPLPTVFDAQQRQPQAALQSRVQGSVQSQSQSQLQGLMTNPVQGAMQPFAAPAQQFAAPVGLSSWFKTADALPDGSAFSSARPHTDGDAGGVRPAPAFAPNAGGARGGSPPISSARPAPTIGPDANTAAARPIVAARPLPQPGLTATFSGQQQPQQGGFNIEDFVNQLRSPRAMQGLMAAFPQLTGGILQTGGIPALMAMSRWAGGGNPSEPWKGYTDADRASVRLPSYWNSKTPPTYDQVQQFHNPASTQSLANIPAPSNSAPVAPLTWSDVIGTPESRFGQPPQAPNSGPPANNVPPPPGMPAPGAIPRTLQPLPTSGPPGPPTVPGAAPNVSGGATAPPRQPLPTGTRLATSAYVEGGLAPAASRIAARRIGQQLAGQAGMRVGNAAGGPAAAVGLPFLTNFLDRQNLIPDSVRNSNAGEILGFNPGTPATAANFAPQMHFMGDVAHDPNTNWWQRAGVSALAGMTAMSRPLDAIEHMQNPSLGIPNATTPAQQQAQQHNFIGDMTNAITTPLDEGQAVPPDVYQTASRHAGDVITRLSERARTIQNTIDRESPAPHTFALRQRLQQYQEAIQQLRAGPSSSDVYDLRQPSVSGGSYGP